MTKLRIGLYVNPWITALLLLACAIVSALGKEPTILKGHAGWIGGVAFAPDGKTLATASADQSVRLWNVTTGEVRATLRGHTDYVGAVAFAPDGRTLATGSYDGTAK